MEKGRKKKQKERGRKRALWNVLEFGGSGWEKKRKEGKKRKEKSKGTCVKVIKRGGKKGKKEGNVVHLWRRKKEGKKGKKEGNAIIIFS